VGAVQVGDEFRGWHSLELRVELGCDESVVH
jgi:hypothetical protein